MIVEKKYRHYNKAPFVVSFSEAVSAIEYLNVC